ncbi:methylated-DNA--[protein]-cysteine S-methyltransferase [Dactylosporangium sp. NPDC048998]|uniref:methylated-DNA--[protein]-cysteine S-methyltransferase n=1 Tax=Dactylosporangium sp. NPDC048998 TaxID=3363976 RepID=UPI003713E642
MTAGTRRHAFVGTTLGELLFVADGAALAGLYFPKHWYPPKESEIGERVEANADPVIAEAARQVREYLAGSRRGFDVPVSTHGDEFSERVWALLRQIPYGQTTTYGALAERLGGKQLAQRVGQSVGHNPVSIVIPCHRVVGADGSLTGFAGGLTRKRALLEVEEPEEARAARLF